jgi:Cu+-exporting ATPase
LATTGDRYAFNRWNICTAVFKYTARVATPTQTPASPPPLDSYQLVVDGMTCPHCVARVEKAILGVDGVRSADVQLETGLARVSGGLPHQVIAAIEAAGYGTRVQAQQADRCALPPTPPMSPAPASAGSYRLDIDEMSCASCVARVEKAILSVAGVREASVNLVEGAAYVVGGDAQQVANAVIDQGYPARPAPVAVTGGATLLFAEPQSSQGQQQIGDLLRTLSSITAMDWRDDRHLQLTTGAHPADCLLALRRAGFAATFVEDTEDPYLAQDRQARLNVRQAVKRAALAATVGGGLMAAMLVGALPSVEPSSALTDISGRGFWLLVALLCLGTMVYSGSSYYAGAWKQLRHAQANMDTLVAVGTAAAWVASALLILAPDFVPAAQRHLYLETSVLILAFLQFGHALEVRARARTGRAIGALVELAPRTVRLVRGGEQLDLPVSLLQPGDLFLVRPGQSVATDGTVIEGTSSIDESMLTGESLAIAKHPGDTVTGGTVNRSGALKVRVDRVGDDTTLAGIIRAVKRAQMSKPPIGRLVDRIAAVFVPAVLVVAGLTFTAWFVLGPAPQLPYALTTAIAVLVIACPCALGLATPIAIMVGMGRAAQFGVLIRNADALQSAAGISHLVVDKTGTLTEGRPRVTAIHCADGIDEDRALAWAASLEQQSEHPLALAVVESAQRRNLSLAAVADFLAEAGQGVKGRIGEQQLFIGRQEWLAELTVPLDDALRSRAEAMARQGTTPVWLASRQAALAVLGLRDPLRADTPAAVRALRGLGIELVMCTGDHPDTARAVAAELGIDAVYSRVLPEDKADVVAQLQARGDTVGMVGDGINDAPALAQAQVGFAIGAGTDVAIESADVTLASNSLASVASAIALSRATLSNIRQNLFGAFVYNVTGIPLAAGVLYPFTGWLLSPVFASIAMALSSVTVVSNANRLRLFKPVE